MAIVGVGAVGSTTAYALITAGAVREIVLSDINRARAEGERMDLEHCVPFMRPVNIEVRQVDEVERCDLIIITAGVAQKPNESRLALVQRNVDIFKMLFPTLTRNNPDSLFLIVTNPVDIMARVGLKLSGLAAEHIFGSGTILDTARFRSLISDHFSVSSANVHSHVIGEHGDSEVLVWSRARVGPFYVGEYSEISGVPLTEDDKARIDRSVRHAAYEIIERKGATHFAIGSACTRLVQSFQDPKGSLYSLSRQFDGLYGLHDICMSIPTLVSRKGAERQIELALSEDERAALMRCAEVLEEVWRGVTFD